MKVTLGGVLLCAAGALCVLVQGCGGGSGSSGGGNGGGNNGNNNNPVPSIASLSPTSAAQNGSAFALTVTGSGFISSSQVQWKGAALSTTYQSASSLTAQVPAGNLSAMGSFDVTVVNASPGGGTSNSTAFTVGNPIPVLASISPTTIPAGSPAFTLTATGSNFVTGSVIEWNGTALTTTFVGSTQLTAQVPASDVVSSAAGATVSVTVVNPSPNGGASSAAQFTIAPALAPTGTHIVEINLPANDIAWDATHARIYASLPSTDTNGNSVVAIDPVTATVGTPLVVGSEPHPLALATDNSFLYVGLDGTGQIERINLPGLTLDTSFNLQLPMSSIDHEQQVATSLAIAPGNPHTFAAILSDGPESTPNTGGTIVYDDATPRASIGTFYNVEDSSAIWGADATALYGIDGTSSGNDLYVMSVNSGGISLTSDYGYLVPTQYGRLHFDSGSKHLYVDGGRVVDPASGNVFSTFNMGALSGYRSPLCALDLQNGLVFFLGQTYDQFNASTGVLIEAFDATTLKLVRSLPIPGLSGHPSQFLRWGNAGLAFNMSNSTAGNWLLDPGAGPIYLVDGAFVNSSVPSDFNTGTELPVAPGLTSISPQSAAAGSAVTTLTVSGNNFDSGATVTWSGAALQTTLVSSTRLQATIPAADLASAGTSIVSVSDTSSSLSAFNSEAFTIVPASSGTTNLSAINLASLDLAWDAKDARLILPVWSADPQYPNSILAIDPSSGSITNSVSAPSDPDLVRVTDDDSTIYLGFRTIGSVSTLGLPSLTAGYSWSLGANYDGPYYAYDLQPAPGAPQTVALAFGTNGVEPPETNGMTIYDSGVARSVSTSRNIGFQNIQWNATDTTLYATDNASELYDYAVNSSGLTQQSHQIITSGTTTLGKVHFDAGTGYLYDDDGDVIDPASYTIIGSVNASGLAIPDSSLNRIFVLGQLSSQTGTSNYTIQAFNEQNYGLVHSLTLNALVGTPVAFVRWGTNGLALVTYNQNASTSNGPAGMLYILSDSTFVSPNVAPASGDSSRELVHAFRRVRPQLQLSGSGRSVSSAQ
jgi:hypothetical protein